MNSRERVLAVLDRRLPDRCPIDFQCTARMAAILLDELKLGSAEELRKYLGCDFRGVGPAPRAQNVGSYYGHVFVRQPREDHFVDTWGITWRRMPMPSGDVFYEVVDAPLKDARSASEVQDYPFPSPPEDWDFSGIRQQALQCQGYAVTGGTAGVFDDAWRMLGFQKMLTDVHANPAVVEATLRRVCDYWLEYGRLVLDAAGGAIDVMWTYDDLGSQNGLLISPEACRRFVIPLVKERTELYHRYGARAAMHSCGGIAPVVGDLAAAGVDALNPIQSAARGMDRRMLKAEFGDRLVFHGSVDQQRVLVPGTPGDVARDTRECIDVLGRDGGYVVASTHDIEADISVENVKAMYLTAQEYGCYR
jgi:uroporphyrinogen decarboxylase